MSSDERSRAPRGLVVVASLVLIALLAGYAVLLRIELRETHDALEEATLELAQTSSELVVARHDADRLIDTLGVLEADSLVRVDLRGGSVAMASGRAFVGIGRGVVLHVSGLPGLAPGRTLQLWALTGSAAFSVGTFEANAFGSATVTRFLPAEAGPLTAISITDEPAGGSSTPSTVPLLTGVVPPG